MRLVLTRDVFTRTTTLSRLSVVYDGALAYGPGGWAADNPRGPLPFGYVCEDEDRGLHRSMAPIYLTRLKVRGETAIPATDGAEDYVVSRTWSNRFHDRTPDGKMILVHDVPVFQGIRVHPGNTDKHTEGCLLPSTVRDVRKAILPGGSTAAWQWLDARVGECDARGEPVRLAVLRDPTAWAAFLAAGGTG